MAWMMLAGLLTYCSGQGPRLCILGALPSRVLEPLSQNQPCLSLVALRGGCSDCGPGASTVSVSRRDGHPDLWTQLWVSHDQ